MIPLGIIQQAAGGGGGGPFDPNNYPGLVSDINPGILASMFDENDDPIAGNEDDRVNRILDQANSPAVGGSGSWWNSANNDGRVYKQSIDGSPAIAFNNGRKFYSYDGANPIAIFTDDLCTVFVVSRLNTGATGYNFPFTTSNSANGWYAVMNDNRTEKRQVGCLADGGDIVYGLLDAQDLTVTPRVQSFIARGSASTISHFRDGVEQADSPVTLHATQGYFNGGEAFLGAATDTLTGTSSIVYIYRVLAYQGLLSQSDHDEITAELTSVYVP